MTTETTSAPLHTLGLVDLHRAGVGPSEAHALAIMALRLGEAERQVRAMDAAYAELGPMPPIIVRQRMGDRIAAAQHERSRLLDMLVNLHYRLTGDLPDDESQSRAKTT